MGSSLLSNIFCFQYTESFERHSLLHVSTVNMEFSQKGGQTNRWILIELHKALFGSANLVRGIDVGAARISWYNEKDRRMLSGSACIRGGYGWDFPRFGKEGMLSVLVGWHDLNASTWEFAPTATPSKKSVQKKVSKYQPVACSLYHMSDIQINSVFRRHAEVSGKYQGNIRKYQGTECRTEASTCRDCKVPPVFPLPESVNGFRACLAHAAGILCPGSRAHAETPVSGCLFRHIISTLRSWQCLKRIVLIHSADRWMILSWYFPDTFLILLQLHAISICLYIKWF